MRRSKKMTRALIGGGMNFFKEKIVEVFKKIHYEGGRGDFIISLFFLGEKNILRSLSRPSATAFDCL